MREEIRRESPQIELPSIHVIECSKYETTYIQPLEVPTGLGRLSILIFCWEFKRTNYLYQSFSNWRCKKLL